MTSPVFTARVPFTAPQIGATYDPQQMRTALNGIARAIPPTVTRSVTANTKIAATDDTLLVDTAAGNVTVTLLPANQVQFLRLQIKNIGTNTVTISGTIDGITNTALVGFASTTIQSDGVGWRRLHDPFDTRYNVLNFGAIPNSSLDASVAFQATANALPQAGATMVIPYGVYRLYSTVDIHAYYGGGSFASSSTTIQLDSGAIVEWWGPAETPMFRCQDLTGQDTNLIFTGGQLDGINGGIGSTGIEIHSMNVTVRDMAIRNFRSNVWNADATAHTWQTGYGNAIKYIYDLVVPPICCVIDNVKMFANGNGVWAGNNAQTASLVIGHGSRIEANQGYGIKLSNASKVELRDFTCEDNGFNDFANLPLTTAWPVGPFYAPEILVESFGECVLDGVYMENIRALQRHNSLTIQASNLSASAVSVYNCRFVNYHGTCISIGENGGQVLGVTIGSGNFFSMDSGPEGGTAIKVGAAVFGLVIDPSVFSESTFKDGAEWLAGTAYAAGVTVQREGINYFCVLANTGNVPPNATYWTRLNTRYTINAAARASWSDVNQFLNGHVITHQNIDMVLDALTLKKTILAGNTISDQASGATGYYRPSLMRGRVTGGALVRSDVQSTLGNSAAFIAAAGTTPIFPTAALAGLGAGNVDSGVHSYKVTFYDAVGESMGGPSSATVTTTASDGQVNLTGLDTGATGTVGRRIYRTMAGGTYYYLLAQIADNVTTVYADNIADASLGVGVPTVSTTNDYQLVLKATAKAASTIGNVHDQPVSGIANNVEQIRWDNTGLFNSRLGYKVASTQVVGPRGTGWNAPTTGGGGLLRGTFDTGATLLQTAETLAAVITDLRTHGLLGT